jgi:hypothetical protein
MRVLKLVSDEFPDMPMYVPLGVKDIQSGLENMLDGSPIFNSDGNEVVTITITSEEMPVEQFEALEPWEP